MRLLAVIPAMGIGGAEAVAATLCREAHLRGHGVRLASAGGFRVQELTDLGIPHVPLSLGSRRPADLARAVRTLRASCRLPVPDLVHAHNVKAAMVARLALGRSVPVLTTLHGVPPGDLAATGQLLRWSSDHVVAVSPHVADQLAAHGVAAEHTTVVQNAMPPLPTHPRAEARARLGLPDGAVVTVCLARMAAQKRHDLLVEAWAGSGRGLLLLAGDGPTRPEIEARVARLGLGDRVRFLGERSDPDWLLAAADLAVLPTDWEGLPISLLEAMGAGVPVVVSRVGGVVETLGDAVRLVEPGTAAPLAAALDELIGDPSLRAVLGRRGQELVAGRFGPTRMVNAYHELYHEVVHQVVARRAERSRR